MISLVYIIGTSITAIIVLALLITTICILRSEMDGFDKSLFGGISGVIAAILAGIWLLATWPSFDLDYHRYDPVTGVVEEADRRLTKDGDGMAEKVVLVVDGQEYGCTDTRCVLIEPGDTVELSCMRIWIYAGSDAFDCEYIAAGRN